MGLGIAVMENTFVFNTLKDRQGMRVKVLCPDSFGLNDNQIGMPKYKKQTDHSNTLLYNSQDGLLFKHKYKLSSVHCSVKSITCSATISI